MWVRIPPQTHVHMSIEPLLSHNPWAWNFIVRTDMILGSILLVIPLNPPERFEVNGASIIIDLILEKLDLNIFG